MAKRNSNKIVDSGKKSKTNVKPTNGKGDEINVRGKEIMGFDKKHLVEILKMMVRARTIDNKALRLLKQGKTFFHIAAEGHEAIQMAIGLHIDPKKDWLFLFHFALTLGK